MFAKHWLRWAITAVMLILAGCGGSEENPGSSAQVPSSESMQESPRDTVANETPEVEPLPVTISMSVQLRSDQRIEVEGQTNLPENARLLVMVEREASGVRWQSRTNVEQSAFSVGPLGPGSGMPDGNYRIIVQLSEASVQPEQVQQRIGQQGQHLTGELVTVSRHGLGQFASYSQRYLIGREPQGDRKEVRILERP